MSDPKFGEWNAVETKNGYFVECGFYSIFTNEPFPIFVYVNDDGSFEFSDNGFINSDFGKNESAVNGIKMVAKMFNFDFDGTKLFAKAVTSEEKEKMLGNFVSLCFALDSTFLGQGVTK
ncbi:MAG: hypothetical protein WCR30_03785 [Clostridia bacterium]